MINKCLFPAAGYGTRFLPVTKAVPKEMLPILTKPLLQFAVEEALSAGIKNMAIVTGKGKRAIEDHFDNALEIESQLIGTSKEHYLKEIKEIIRKSTFTYTRQKKMLGLGDAVLTAKPLIGKQPFAMILADDLCDYSKNSLISQMIQIYIQYECSIVAFKEVPMNQTKNYGIINAAPINDSKNIFNVVDLIEKPQNNEFNSNMAIIGRYILTPDIFDILSETKPDENGEVQITDALKIQAKQGRLLAYKFEGRRFDCGSVKGYLDANNFYAHKHGLL
jgi:UTP--glucose-1-phosphate uridylyltransferase